jgi:Glycosyltransferase family 87
MHATSQREIHLRDLRELAKPTNDWAKVGPPLGVAFCLLIYYITVFTQALLSFSSTIPFLDYGSLYASVYAWAHRLNPYLNYPLTNDPKLGVRGLFVHAVNLNPPISLYMFRPIVAVGPIASVELWTLVSVCLFCMSLILVIRANPNPALRTRILLTLGMAGVWYTFQLGQIYMILLFITAIAWWSFKKNDFAIAGIAIGILCALKPTFLIWPVLLILARHIRAGISAILTFAALSMVPLVFGDGVRIYRQWFTACQHFNGIGLPGNSAIMVMFMRLDPYRGITHNFRDIGVAVTIVFLLAIAWCVWRRAPEICKTSEVALVASLLAGPVSWVGYTVVLIPMLYEKRLNSLMRVGWVLLCIPLFLVIGTADSSPVHYVLMGSPYFYGIALIATPLIYDLYRAQTNRQTLSKAELSVSGISALPEPGGAVMGKEK